VVGPYRSDADGLAGALKKLKCVNVEIDQYVDGYVFMVRIICSVYVIYVRANTGWQLLVSSMIIMDWFGIEKVVMDDFII
jgi:hypothetical protein